MNPAEAETWLTDVLPIGVSAVVVELADEPGDDDLWPIERAAVVAAVEVRRREFMIGRRCARRALARLGSPPVALPVGPDREPVWPAGFVGSITHTRQLVGALAARPSTVRSVGLDFELAGSVDAAVVDRILTTSEQERHIGADLAAATIIFSAKEAIYKATFPLTRCWLGFEDVEIDLNLDAGTFEAEVLPGVEHPMAGARLHGFHRSALGHVLSAVVL